MPSNLSSNLPSNTCKMLRANIELEQVPYDDLKLHVGFELWFCTTEECGVVHGPYLLQLLSTGKLELVNPRTDSPHKYPVESLQLCNFWKLPASQPLTSQES